MEGSAVNNWSRKMCCGSVGMHAQVLTLNSTCINWAGLRKWPLLESRMAALATIHIFMITQLTALKQITANWTYNIFKLLPYRYHHLLHASHHIREICCFNPKREEKESKKRGYSNIQSLSLWLPSESSQWKWMYIQDCGEQLEDVNVLVFFFTETRVGQTWWQDLQLKKEASSSAVPYFFYH